MLAAGERADARRLVEEIDQPSRRVLGRPISGDAGPDEETLVRAVATRMKTPWHPREANLDRVGRIVREYLAVKPWPFGALRP